MKFRNYIICILFFSISLSIYPQKINIQIPDNANLNYVFVLNKGLKQDTIQRGNFDITGNIIINIPEKYKDYKGIGFLYTKGKQSLNLVINHENFVVKREGGEYIFMNSAENDYLYTFLQQKTNFEKADTTLYAYRFMNIFLYMTKLNAVINGQAATLAEKFAVHDFALNKLNIEDLYTSSLWFYVIDGLTKYNLSQEQFANDMIKILSRIKSQEVFEALSENLITILNQYGWDDAFDIIIPYIVETGRIEVPQGKMFTAFTLAKLRKGMDAPPIEGLSKPLNKSKADFTILYFYESGCHNCRHEIEILRKNYSDLQAKKIRLISISADYDRNEFKNMAKTLPWKDNICDFKGFVGSNFINYGILGTPTYFLLDSDHKIIKRFAKFEELILQ